MSTYTNTFVMDIGTTANFQALMNQIHTEILAFGWIDNGDSGQVNLATAASPGANTDAGYRMYKTGDALTTIVMKILYGEGSSSPFPRLTISFGTGSDGAGTLTGNVSASIVCVNSSSMTGTHRLYMSGSVDRLMIFVGDSNASPGANYGISIHRIVDGTGASISGGMDIFFINNTGSPVMSQRFHPTSGTIPNVETTWTAVMPNRATNILDTKTMTGHPQTWESASSHNPTPAVFIGGTTDFTPGSGAGTTTTLPLYSVNRTFLITAQTGPITGFSNLRAMFLYD